MIAPLAITPLPGDDLDTLLRVSRAFTAELHPDTRHPDLIRTPFVLMQGRSQRPLRWAWRGAGGARCWAQVVPGLEGIHPYYVVEPEEPGSDFAWFRLRSEPLFRRHPGDCPEAREDIRLMDWSASQVMTILAGDLAQESNQYIHLVIAENDAPPPEAPPEEKTS